MLRMSFSVLAIVAVTSSCFGEEWPSWRGSDRTGVAKETGLLKTWPKDGPPLAWKSEGLGHGYASVVISGGKVFTQGDKGKDHCLIAVNLDNHKIAWTTKICQNFSDGSRSTPTVDGEHVYALSPHGDLICATTAEGKIVWLKHLPKDFGGHMMSGWGYSESVLIDGDKLICTPGGDNAAVIALNKESGELIWKAAVPQGGGAGYASPVIAEVGGIRQYVTLLGKSGGAVGISAKDGKLLWRNNKFANGTANIPTPVVKDDLVFYSTGYDDGGSALLRLVPDGDGVKAEEVYGKPARDLQNHHGGVILIGDHLYGGHGNNHGFPFCIDFKTGKESWGKNRGPGTGSAAVVYADGHLYFRYDNAVMALIEATPEKCTIKSSFKIPQGSTPSWAHPVVFNGKLYLRDQDRLLCYDVKDASARK